MKILTKFVSATVKSALTPVAVVKDIVNIAKGKEVTATKELIESVDKDINDAVDEIKKEKSIDPK